MYPDQNRTHNLCTCLLDLIHVVTVVPDTLTLKLNRQKREEIIKIQMINCIHTCILIKIELTISAPFDLIHVVAVPDTLTLTITREKRVEIVKMDAGAKRMAEIVRRRITTTSIALRRAIAAAVQLQTSRPFRRRPLP